MLARHMRHRTGAAASSRSLVRCAPRCAPHAALSAGGRGGGLTPRRQPENSGAGREGYCTIGGLDAGCQN